MGEIRGRGKPRNRNRGLMDMDSWGVGLTVDLGGDGMGERNGEKSGTTVIEQQ